MSPTARDNCGRAVGEDNDSPGASSPISKEVGTAKDIESERTADDAQRKRRPAEIQTDEDIQSRREDELLLLMRGLMGRLDRLESSQNRLEESQTALKRNWPVAKVKEQKIIVYEWTKMKTYSIRH